MTNNGKTRALRFPVLEHGAESLVQGYLMRRNILTYQAPRNNEGYDLICISPDSGGEVKPIRVQVKSRYQTDCDRSIIVSKKSRGAFDFVFAVFLNVGCFFGKKTGWDSGKREPEFYTLPADWVEQHRSEGSKWGKVSLRGKNLNIDDFKNERGFEQIAKALQVRHPARPLAKAGNAQRPTTKDQRRRTND